VRGVSEVVGDVHAGGDHSLRLSQVKAFAHPANAGSRRVLEKACFEVVQFVPEMDRFLYRRQARATGGSRSR